VSQPDNPAFDLGNLTATLSIVPHLSALRRPR
jgi:hypothetical protein